MTKKELVKLQQEVTLLRAEGKYKDTIQNCFSLLNASMEMKDYKSILTAYINLAASYYCIGDIEEAFKCIEEHEAICNIHGDDLDKLNSYNISFLIYEYNKNIDKSKATLEKSIALGKKLNKYNIVSNAYSNYSHICMLDEDYNKALEMGILGLDAAKLHKPASPILELRVKLNIAKAYIYLKDFHDSKVLLDEMLNSPFLDSFPREKSQCYDLEGQWYREQNLYRQAYESFTNAKVIVESYNDIYLLKTIQEERCKLCELMDDFNLGYKLQKEYISILKEISERELSLAALKLEIKHNIMLLEKKAYTDQLTGIYNRDYLENTTNNWLNEAYQKNESVVCLVLDIDRFKCINDEFGHLFGDEVVKQVSRACSNIIREDDLIGRFGGDEFVIILRGASLNDGIKKAEQILETIRSLNINYGDKTIDITVSIGVTDNLDSMAMHFSELFRAADMRLYKAKRSGRNQICAVS
ncbi:GGDEF domain-containing protein [Clostridium sp. YIM B02515]|uniref:GGDEF domain-containing protein n=1 Tax=Clostridium rhizosphaerae TaxID=2803861 RepID=A0ABS1TBK5_9CLOT|nr:GGDEF domain-containing protein [Clostridium rhizosphaerae]MBL4935689.1 GGDEF domain-containing protein [Clostridium rhizosphaerae]